MLSVFFFEIIATTIAATASSLLTILSVEIEIKEFKWTSFYHILMSATEIALCKCSLNGKTE